MIEIKRLFIFFLVALLATNYLIVIAQQHSDLVHNDHGELDEFKSFNKNCNDKSFVTIPLGTAGGLDESNLSSFLLARKGSNAFVTMDAGTIWKGISKYIRMIEETGDSLMNIQFPVYATTRDQKVAWFIRNHIVGYLLGHSHLDHLEGLIEVSPEDVMMKANLDLQPPITDGLLGMLRGSITNVTAAPNILKKKVMVGLNNTLTAVKNNLFNGVLWPNLPAFGRYDYVYMSNGQTSNMSQVFGFNNVPSNITNSIFDNMLLTSFETCHNDLISTAYLMTDSVTGEQIVFFSDTGVPTGGTYGCDYREKINNVWRSISINKLKAIFIECSFPDAATDGSMFGHLRPRDILSLLDNLVEQSIQTIPPTNSLSHVKLIIEHIKPQVNPTTETEPISKVIYNQLMSNNVHNITVIIPKQGVPICI